MVMEEIRPRFEFRVWGRHVDDAGTSLLRSANSLDPALRSTEMYVVALTRGDVNAKIRGGVMDIKVLRSIVDGCEQWFPWTKAEFPLAVALIEAWLPRLGVSGFVPERSTYDFDQFINEVVGAAWALHPVAVDKVRQRFEVEGCLADLAEIVADDRELRTLAIESADLDALIALRRRLGLEGLVNVNYPAALKDALGLTLDDVR
jgi:hypothetical protein